MKSVALVAGALLFMASGVEAANMSVPKKMTVAKAGGAKIGGMSTAKKKKLLICGMTINSKDEIETFIKYLRPGLKNSAFEFVELTKMGRHDRWFANACAKRVQCDILVVSAHFGGTLFGDNNKIRLSFREMETASCNNTCDGILKRPKEVFLFTCNMLAGKGRDTRTPRQYYNVLLQYYPPRLAQYYVQTRYGAWGGTFLGRTRRTFFGVPRLYGYGSVSPYGPQSARLVESYLRSVGKYETHLKKNTLPHTPNPALAYTLGRSGMMQRSGVMPGSLGSKVRTNLCGYFNADGVSSKASVLAGLLRKKQFEPYLTYVEEFYREEKPQHTAGHLDIKANTRVRDHILRMINVSVSMPHTRIDLVNFAGTVGWIDRKQRVSHIQKIMRDLYSSKVDVDKAWEICSVGRRHGDFIGRYLDYKFIESIRPASRWNETFIETVGCLRPRDPKLQDTIAGFMDAEKYNWKYRWSAAYSFMDTKPVTDFVRRRIVQAAMNDPHKTVRSVASRAMKTWNLRPLPKPKPKAKPTTPLSTKATASKAAKISPAAGGNTGVPETTAR